MGRFVFERARPEDEPSLRRVMRDNAMPGAVSVAFCREPDFFAAAAVEGPTHDAIVARAPDGEVVGLCARSVRRLWLGGEAREVAYLSSLRLDAAWRGRVRLLREGFAAVRALHEARGPEAPLFTTILSDNAPARRILTRGLPGFPRYEDRGELVTLAISCARARPPRARGFTTRAATPEELPSVLGVLAEASRAFDLRPAWTAEDLADPRLTPGLGPGDLLLAERAGRVVGCVALWDQRAVKQSVVTGYAPALARTRPLVNLAAPWLGLPHLPAPGQRFSHASLSHLALPEGEDGLALVQAACAEARARGVDHVTLGLPSAHPLTAPLARATRARALRARVYAVSWEDPAPPWGQDRPAWPEAAVL